MYSIRARRDIADNGDTDFAAKWQSSNLYIWGAHNRLFTKIHLLVNFFVPGT